jgi:fatty acid-binding protein DegV
MNIREIIDLCAKRIANELSKFLETEDFKEGEELMLRKVEQMRQNGLTEEEIAQKLSKLLQNIREVN